MIDATYFKFALRGLETTVLVLLFYMGSCNELVAQGYTLAPNDSLPISIQRLPQSGSPLVFDQPAASFKLSRFSFHTLHSEIPISANPSSLIYTCNGIPVVAGLPLESRKASSFEIHEIGKLQGMYFRLPRNLTGGVRSSQHDGPGALTRDRRLFVFSRSKPENATSKASHGQLYFAKAKKRGFGKRLKFWFCSHRYDYLHPAISADGKTLVFAADLPGGIGGTDLYSSRLFENGWTQPVNLGPNVNTEGDEVYPTLDAKGNLFFSSSGYRSFGGLDIFFAEKEGAKWKEPQHLGSPFNSSQDDFQVVWEKDGVSGYFATNRDSAFGTEIMEFERNVEVELRLEDAETKAPVVAAMVEIRNVEGKVSFVESDSTGVAHYFCRPQTLLELFVNHPQYRGRAVRIGTSETAEGDKLSARLGLAFQKKFVLHGRILNSDHGEMAPSASLYVMDKETEEVLSSKLDSLGNYRIEFPRNRQFTVVFGAEGFISQVVEANTMPPNYSFEKEYDVMLEKGGDVLLFGKVVDQLGGQPLPNVALRIVNNNNQKLGELLESDSVGRFWTVIPKDSVFNCSVIASKTGYFSARLDVDPSESGKKSVFLKMKLAEYGLDKVVKVIQFDYGKSLLAPLSKKDLNEICYFMVENKEAVLEIGAHTDSRGSKSYNQQLSQKRAEEIVQFILEKRAVPRERLRAKGYGESILLNNCDDSRDCTEEGHSENRRAEIKVVKIEE